MGSRGRSLRPAGGMYGEWRLIQKTVWVVEINADASHSQLLVSVLPYLHNILESNPSSQGQDVWGHLEGRGTNVTNTSFKKANWFYQHRLIIVERAVLLLLLFQRQRSHQPVMRLQKCVICQRGGGGRDRTSYLWASALLHKCNVLVQFSDSKWPPAEGAAATTQCNHLVWQFLCTDVTPPYFCWLLPPTFLPVGWQTPSASHEYASERLVCQNRGIHQTQTEAPTRKGTKINTKKKRLKTNSRAKVFCLVGVKLWSILSSRLLLQESRGEFVCSLDGDVVVFFALRCATSLPQRGKKITFPL